jgi:spore coat polysaccharide biosynthesis protein SpsF
MKAALKKAIGDGFRSILAADLKRLNKQVADLQAENKRVSRLATKSDERLTALIDMVGSLYMDGADTSGMTAQERAWFGKHGFRYIIHHMGEDWEKTRLPIWQLILPLIPDVTSVCEFGANIGANMKAIRHLRPDLIVHGVEVNPVACRLLRGEGFDAKQDSIAEVALDRKFDIVFSRGVLIHIKPSDLHKAMRNMAKHSSRYVMIYEHYSEAMKSLDGYAKAVAKTTGEESEGYQFWGDFPNEFKKLHPDWKHIRSGVNLDIDRAPKEGDLHWTIFENLAAGRQSN